MLLTRKSTSVSTAQSRFTRSVSGMLGKTIDRRTFLTRSGVALGAGAVATQLPFNILEKAEAAQDAGGKIEVKRTVCTHCSVGCAVDAEVQNGVWIRQEPVFDSPINLGAYCTKGAAIRDHGATHDSHRLKYPMKLAGGKWQRISWDQALSEVSQKLLQIKKESGPDATYWIGSSKHSNENSFLLRKFVSFFGTNNMDHQARIC
ncbi:MAG: molybdopterin-dependent oxidoreductase, partial [Betaproteobacteria bacterium]|nr:molybdopterin-dependent oxidoreductase [Betaproteobacteria bacterium]